MSVEQFEQDVAFTYESGLCKPTTCSFRYSTPDGLWCCAVGAANLLKNPFIGGGSQYEFVRDHCGLDIEFIRGIAYGFDDSRHNDTPSPHLSIGERDGWYVGNGLGKRFLPQKQP